MYRPMRWIILLAGSCLLGACTPMEWRRGDEVATMESVVYRQCSNYAQVEGMRRMPLFGFPQPSFIGRDRNGRPVYVAPSFTRSDQMMVEHSALMRCMLDQGFDLVPIASEVKQTP